MTAFRRKRPFKQPEMRCREGKFESRLAEVKRKISGPARKVQQPFRRFGGKEQFYRTIFPARLLSERENLSHEVVSGGDGGEDGVHI